MGRLFVFMFSLYKFYSTSLKQCSVVFFFFFFLVRVNVLWFWPLPSGSVYEFFPGSCSLITRFKANYQISHLSLTLEAWKW